MCLFLFPLLFHFPSLPFPPSLPSFSYQPNLLGPLGGQTLSSQKSNFLIENPRHKTLSSRISILFSRIYWRFVNPTHFPLNAPLDSLQFFSPPRRRLVVLKYTAAFFFCTLHLPRRIRILLWRFCFYFYFCFLFLLTVVSSKKIVIVRHLLILSVFCLSHFWSPSSANANQKKKEVYRAAESFHKLFSYAQVLFLKRQLVLHLVVSQFTKKRMFLSGFWFARARSHPRLIPLRIFPLFLCFTRWFFYSSPPLFVNANLFVLLFIPPLYFFLPQTSRQRKRQLPLLPPFFSSSSFPKLSSDHYPKFLFYHTKHTFVFILPKIEILRHWLECS